MNIVTDSYSYAGTHTHCYNSNNYFLPVLFIKI